MIWAILNKWLRNEACEVSFEDVSIKRIQTAATKKCFLDGRVYGDSLKLELGDGRKCDFRTISKENGAMLHDAILGVQDTQP